MALEKSPPTSPISSPTGPPLDVRSHVPSLPGSQRHPTPPRPLYTVRGNEPWISRRDMDRLRQLAEPPDAVPSRDADRCAPAIKALPRGCKLRSMVGEGAANAVFEFELPDGGHLYHDSTRLLLRVAKEPVEPDHPRFDYIEQQWYHQTRIKPILGDHILHSELAVIRNSGIVEAINEHLRRHDQTRKRKFRGTFIGESDWAFLVEDMRPENDDGLLVEFKPKWLSQSPSAPKKAIRCRQCAKELHSYVVDPDLRKPVPTMAKPCPLTLGRDEHNLVRADSAHRLLPWLDSLGHRDHLSTTLNMLRDAPALKMLRMAQQKNDRVGPLDATESDTDFALAMTLRDCTCLAQIPRRASRERDSARPVKVRFGDFDMKNSHVKLEYWRKVEQQLISGGFYTASWISCRGTRYRPPTRCVLELLNGGREDGTEMMYIVDTNTDANTNGANGTNGTNGTNGANSTNGTNGTNNGRLNGDDTLVHLSRTARVCTVKTDAAKLQACLESLKAKMQSSTPEKWAEPKQNGRRSAYKEGQWPVSPPAGDETTVV